MGIFSLWMFQMPVGGFSVLERNSKITSLFHRVAAFDDGVQEIREGARDVR